MHVERYRDLEQLDTTIISYLYLYHSNYAMLQYIICFNLLIYIDILYAFIPSSLQCTYEVSIVPINGNV